ncbi:MAG TPA: zf-HC2 domain-containing protein, partial [Gemmatimonadales bacterium]
MPHVDEGQLAAYADGALDTRERAQVDEHLATCAECRSGLEPARTLATQASAILAGAGPRVGDLQSFDTVAERARRTRRMRSWVRPAVWAATLVMAVGLGWYGRTLAPVPTHDLTPSPSPLRGEGSGTKAPFRAPVAHAPAVPSAALASQPARAFKTADRLDSGRLRDVQSADIRNSAGAGAAVAGASGVAEAREATPPPAAPRVMQARPNAGRLELGAQVVAGSTAFVVEGLAVISRGVADGAGLKTIQQIDTSHRLELVQDAVASTSTRSGEVDQAARLPKRDSMNTVVF